MHKPLAKEGWRVAPESITLGSVCAVVVVYNTGDTYASCFHSLIGQVDHVIAVNTSTDGGVTARFLKNLALQHPEFLDVVESPENNLGVAQNLGIEKALSGGFDWVLLLDHDSQLHAGMLAAQDRALRPMLNRDQIAIIAPNLIDPDLPDMKTRYLRLVQQFWFEQVGFSDTQKVIDRITCVSASGSLISSRILKETGIRMDEGFVIDGIDTDFCLRLNDLGYRIIAAEHAKLTHKVGNRKQHSMLGIQFSCTHHSPIRRYYFNRNRIAIWKRCSKRMAGFVFFDLMRLVYELWRILLLEDQKNDKIHAVVEGLWDGVMGRSGAKAGTDLTRTPADKDHR